MACLQGVEGLGMAGLGDTLGSPWPSLAVRPCFMVQTILDEFSIWMTYLDLEGGSGQSHKIKIVLLKSQYRGTVESRLLGFQGIMKICKLSF
jgi:hypothetical protein